MGFSADCSLCRVSVSVVPSHLSGTQQHRDRSPGIARTVLSLVMWLWPTSTRAKHAQAGPLPCCIGRSESLRSERAPNMLLRGSEKRGERPPWPGLEAWRRHPQRQLRAWAAVGLQRLLPAPLGLPLCLPRSASPSALATSCFSSCPLPCSLVGSHELSRCLPRGPPPPPPHMCTQRVAVIRVDAALRVGVSDSHLCS